MQGNNIQFFITPLPKIFKNYSPSLLQKNTNLLGIINIGTEPRGVKRIGLRWNYKFLHTIYFFHVYYCPELISKKNVSIE